ncbi:MAG: protein-glutamate O-methyltransferase CheR [Coriobacteriia bacterium]
MSSDRTISKDLSIDEFRRFRDYIQRHAGIYLEEQKLDSLRISIVTRATRLGVTDIDEYFRLFTESEDEFKELLNLITINETYFFRFPQQFDALREHVLPEIARRKESGVRTLRAWSAGCSTGEEAYSIAMTVVDSGIQGLGWEAQVMGTDVSTKALGVARRGVYRGKAISGLDESVLERHFVRVEDGWQVAPHVRKIVDFAYHNLIKEPYPLSLMGNWDIIFCRNVTIYFKLESTRRVLANFYSSLNEGGYLFIGHSETLSGITDEFEPVEVGGVFLYRKPYGRASTIFAGFDSTYRRFRDALDRAEEPAQEDEAAEQEPARSVAEKIELAKALLAEGRKEEAHILLEEATEEDPHDAHAHLLSAYVHADTGEYDVALEECEKALAANPLLPSARHVLGLIHLRRGELVKAAAEFKKAVYLDPDFVLAYLNLGNIYKRQGKFAAACSCYENAVRSLERGEEGEWAEFMGGFTADLIRKTCERSLIECRKATGIA